MYILLIWPLYSRIPAVHNYTWCIRYTYLLIFNNIWVVYSIIILDERVVKTSYKINIIQRQYNNCMCNAHGTIYNNM